MLRIREGKQDLAGYLTGRLILEDALWKALFELGRAATLEELVDSVPPSLAVHEVPLDRLERLLYLSSRRFHPEGGRWGLTVWHIPRNRPFWPRLK